MTPAKEMVRIFILAGYELLANMNCGHL